MGRATELIALSNMTSDERKRFAYGNNAATYFTHITIDTELLKKVKPKINERAIYEDCNGSPTQELSIQTPTQSSCCEDVERLP
jgi:hypothetical protein